MHGAVVTDTTSPEDFQGNDGTVQIDAPPLFRGKRHDYFTSCLPWPQKGPGVELPLSGNANLIGNAPVYTDHTKFTTIIGADGSANKVQGGLQPSSSSFVSPVTNPTTDVPTNLNVHFTGSGAYADLSTVSAVTINSLRTAFQLQKLYERDARGGTRYTEILRSHFGVVSPDARLQRPEFLGGSSSPIIINPIAQTSSTDATTPQGNLSAYATTSMKAHGFSHSFTEGWIS